MAVEDEQVAGLEQDGDGGRHVVIDDLDVAAHGVRSLIGHMGVHRLGVRSGQHPQTAVLDGRLGDGQPHADLMIGGEGEVVGVLMPGLTERAGVLEDELAQEAVELGAEDGSDEVEQALVAGEVGEDRVARAGQASVVVKLEHLAYGVLGFASAEGGQLGFVGDPRRHRFARSPAPAYVDDPLEHRLTDLRPGEGGDDEEPVRLPLGAVLVGEIGTGQHTEKSRDRRGSCLYVDAVASLEETCDICDFDSRDWSVADLAGTVRALGPWWHQSVDGVDAELLDERPAPGVWSAAEYAAHSRMITGGLGRLMGAALKGDRPKVSVGEPVDAKPGDPPLSESFGEIVDGLAHETSRLNEVIMRFGARDVAWRNEAIIDGEVRSAEAILVHLVHDATHHLADIARGLHRLGAPPGSGVPSGTVAQLNVSSGGVPKLPVDMARIGRRGVEGDTQRTRRHHGRPWQAICLWSSEVIDRLRAEGHPVAPGATGENITVRGVDWRTLRSGVRLGVGDVVLECSLQALPCKKNARWFIDGDFNRMLHGREEGVSRMYAWVRRGGVVRPGDPVVVEP